MSETADNADVVMHPPIAWALAFVIGLCLNYLYPLPFVPAAVPHVWVGIVVFAAGFALGIWGMLTIRGAGTRVETNKPTTMIVTHGPYRFSRNPIYLGMFLGLIGLAIGCDSLWILLALVLFYLMIRYGVVAREEAYLTRKFGADYLGFKTRVRRWL